MTTPKRNKGGRPRTGRRPRLEVTLDPELDEWLRRHHTRLGYRSVSAAIADAVREFREKNEAA